ncbi:MAG: Ig-like domain repeat protein, partial [Methanobrevibacter sp.]|nr:Ig-like domain repeat protein [Methanobrevibacter sp.]
VENGKIKGIRQGEANITVSFAGNENYTAAENKTIAVTVNLNDASVTVNNETLNLEVGQNFTIVANTVPEGVNVTYVQDDSGVYIVDENGVVTALKNGTGSILVKIGGDGVYAENSTIVNVTVSKVPTEITVDPDSLDLFVGDETVIAATLTPSDAGNVSFTSSDDSIVIVDGKGNVIANGKGQAIITVSFAGDNKYAESENKTITVDVSLNDASVTVDNDTLDLKVDERYQINATKHPDSILLDITYTSSNNTVATVDENGIVTALSEGTAIITVEVGDGEIYAENSTNITVNVKKINTTMDISASEITEGENATITITLPSDATGNVTTTFNGKTYSSEVKDGKAVITVPDLLKGDYTLPIIYSGDDKYNPLTKDLNITVEGGKAIISAPDLVKYYSGSERFVVNLTYAKGSPAANKAVNITINGVTYPRTTDEKGIASLNINLGAGKYDVTINADDVTADSVVTVLSTINASDVESKTKSLVFTAAFIDGEGNPLADGTLVTFNVKGVIYNSTVKGGKGSASVDLTLDSGRYIITSYNPVSGENASNNIAVNLKDVDMILSADEITVGENATIGVTLPSDATGNVTASVNGKSYQSKVNDGKANILIPALAAGNYTIPVTYSGDDKYNSAAGDANITVNKADATITVDAPAITEGENATVTVTLASDATGSVTIGNESVPVKDGTASAVLTDLPVGTNTVPVTYSGDDKYNPVETSADIIVNEKPVPAKENLTIKATADEITEGENATVIITGLENATGNVSASANGKTYAAPINNGKATITVSGLSENATAAINYPGDDKYNPAVTAVNITVNRNTVTITAENLTKYYKDPQKFTVTVTDAKGQAAPNKTVDITINGVTYKRTTDENGTASLNINLGAGEYPVSVAVDDVVVNSTVIVKSTVDASDVVKMFRNDTQYYARFSDSNGNTLANTNVSFNINGVIYNRTTDANGTAKMNINMAAGDYIVTATNPVTGEMKSNSIKVISLIESDDLTKYYKNASQFVVRIHSADGGYVGAGEEVTFNINGVFYTRTTNATGHAKLNINLPQGNYTITTYYKNCSQGNEITVLPVLSADDLVMKYRDGSQFKAKLVDGQGKAYVGQSVQFNINGVLYNRVTGSDGVAKLNINLMAGQYIITSSYNGFNTANKITIRG